MNSAEILFLPDNVSVTAGNEPHLLALARNASVEIESPCNGKGTCGKCRIQVMEGEAAAPHPDELQHLGSGEIEEGVRLACRTKVAGRAVVRHLGGRRKHRILSEGVLPDFRLDPFVTKRFVQLPLPRLEDNRDDLQRLEDALGVVFPEALPLPFLQRLPALLRESGFAVTVIFAVDRPIGIEPGDTTRSACGVAVDIGTTTVVASLIDLTSGVELDSASMINAQKDYGLDVLSRIHYLKEHPDALHLLSRLVREGIDRLIGELCGRSGIKREAIYEVAIAANTTMTHLFLGVDAAGIGASPYAPAFTSAMTLPAGEAGLSISPFGRVFCLPSVSGYIGADIVGGLLACELEQSERPSLLIDIGTNGEIVAGSKDGLFACSCAAGPALEGMNISCGVRAAEGAIERIVIGGSVEVATIGDRPAAGICGSGIIDAVAELVKVGAIGRSGRFVRLSGSEPPAPWHSRLKSDGSGRFVLAATSEGEIAVTQKDIRQVQLAKGAILSGILSLTSRLSIPLSDIDRIYIAGAFGHHVRKESLARLGVFPAECLDRVVLIGNSSKSGAILCLLSREKRLEATRLARRVGYVELSCHPGYDRLFTDALAFPESGSLE